VSKGSATRGADGSGSESGSRDQSGAVYTLKSGDVAVRVRAKPGAKVCTVTLTGL
jgi:hypothetical protein